MAEAAPRTRFDPWPATVFTVLVVLAVLFLLPTAGALLSSVKTTRDIAMGDLWSLPPGLYLGNFAEVLGNPSVHRYFLNTLLVTLPKGKSFRVYVNAPGKRKVALGEFLVPRKAFPDVIFARVAST